MSKECPSPVDNASYYSKQNQDVDFGVIVSFEGVKRNLVNGATTFFLSLYQNHLVLKNSRPLKISFIHGLKLFLLRDALRSCNFTFFRVLSVFCFSCIIVNSCINLLYIHSKSFPGFLPDFLSEFRIFPDFSGF